MVYHVNCIEANGDTGRVKNILAQDRGYRRRLEGEREASRELELRAQMYRFVFGSVLDDTFADHPIRKRGPRSPLGLLRPGSGLEDPVSATRGSALDTVNEKLL